MTYQCYDKNNPTLIYGIQKISDAYGGATVGTPENLTVNGVVLTIYPMSVTSQGRSRRAWAIVPPDATDVLALGYHGSNGYTDSRGGYNLIADPASTDYEKHWLAQLCADKRCCGMAISAPIFDYGYEYWNRAGEQSLWRSHDFLTDDGVAYAAYMAVISGTYAPAAARVFIAGQSWGGTRTMFAAALLKGCEGVNVIGAYAGGCQVDKTIDPRPMFSPPDFVYGNKNYVHVVGSYTFPFQLQYYTNDGIWANYPTNRAQAQSIDALGSNWSLRLDSGSVHMMNYPALKAFFETVD